MSLRTSYTFIAPFYDQVIRPAFDKTRQSVLQDFPTGGMVLVNGIGTGLDLPHLPVDNHYIGLDLTPAMLGKIATRRNGLHLDLVQGDSQQLPFADASFDHAILHLILAVIPSPAQCLAEAARVVKPGGTLQIVDKFLHPGEFAPLRRTLNILLRHVATRTDVVFEEIAAQVPALKIISDQPLLGGDWFRCIRLEKCA